MIKLYDLELSGNCYKVRLLLNFLNVDHQLVPVDLLGGEHKQPAFLQINPKGQLPALETDAGVIGDSQAILTWLAETNGPTAWYPQDPFIRAQIQTWLSTAANEIAHGPATARLVKLFGMAFDYEKSVATTNSVMDLINAHLSDKTWLVGNQPTLADIAVFPYVALIADGGLNLDSWPNVAKWVSRFQELPHFISMPGIPAAVA